jgi:NAD+--asparagine ADP-ribosyltransferase
MAFPLIPFAAGVALGSLVTYGAKDEALQRRIAALADTSAARVRSGAEKLAGSMTRLGARLRSKAAAAATVVQEGAGEISDKAKAVVDEAVAKAKRAANAHDGEAQPSA